MSTCCSEFGPVIYTDTKMKNQEHIYIQAIKRNIDYDTEQKLSQNILLQEN